MSWGFTRLNMRKPHISAKLRKAIADRARGCCEYCISQASFSAQSFSVEHIIPYIKGGKTEPDNLALSCQGCNNHKHVRTDGFDPISNGIVPLYHPRQQIWIEHFIWNDDYSLIIGLTPIGRATVEILRLNRDGVVNLRRLLYAVKKHPPF
jgi:hypothetical protein